MEITVIICDGHTQRSAYLPVTLLCIFVAATWDQQYPASYVLQKIFE